MKYDSSDIDKPTKIDKILKFTFYTAVAGLTLTLVRCAEPAPVYKIQKSHLSDQDIQMIELFEAFKSPSAIELGIAVNKTRHPKVLAGIAIVESNGDINAIGDRGESKGAFQVQEKYWGPVPATATEQALQAEKILDELLGSNPRGSLRYSLAQYNGGINPPRVSFKYADKVMKIKRRCHDLERYNKVR